MAVEPAAKYVWLNGTLLPAGAAHLSVYDRGFQLGDGVFEALRARRGVAIELDGHLARLRNGLAVMAIEPPFADGALAAGISELLAALGWDGTEPPGDAAVRITVSRGFDATRGVAPHPGVASAVIQAWPFAPPSAETLGRGERVITSAIRRNPDSPIAGIKSTSRAELVYARIEAERAGADDAIFLTTDGLVAEATSSNVLLIKGDVCITPRLGTGLLPGTTRAWMVAHADAVGLEMAERDVTLHDVYAADEMAVCASIGGFLPVVAVDGRAVGSGKPGPRTMAMREARERWIDEVSRGG